MIQVALIVSLAFNGLLFLWLCSSAKEIRAVRKEAAEYDLKMKVAQGQLVTMKKELVAITEKHCGNK